jgi:hypothetical protein
MSTQTATTSGSRIVRIATRATGVNFGHLGIISARNGRIIWTSNDVYPFVAAALAAAKSKAAREGWTVA